MLDVTPVTFKLGKLFSLIDDMMKCWRQYEKIYNSGQNICKMWQNQTNVNNTRKVWYLLLSNFWLILPKTNTNELIRDSRLCPHQISKNSKSYIVQHFVRQLSCKDSYTIYQDPVWLCWIKFLLQHMVPRLPRWKILVTHRFRRRLLD